MIKFYFKKTLNAYPKRLNFLKFKMSKKSTDLFGFRFQERTFSREVMIIRFIRASGFVQRIVFLHRKSYKDFKLFTEVTSVHHAYPKTIENVKRWELL
jgi:hypothetical protein